MKQTIDLLASDFEVDLSNSYSLSIRQLPDGYSFSVTDESKKKCLAIKHIKSMKSAHELSKEPLLQLTYRNICFFGYGAFSMVPKSLLTNENYAQFLPIEKNLKHRATTIVNLISKDEVIISHTNQWTIPSLKVETHHEIELLVALAQHQDVETSVWSEIVADKINIVITINHKIILINSYVISTEHDAAYYILACYQQFNLSQENVPLNITGDLLTINPIPFLNDYIRHIKPIKPSMWNDEFNNNYASFFTLQINQYLLCE